MTSAVEVLRAEGIRALIVKALAAACYGRLHLYERPLGGSIPDFEHRSKLETGRLSEADGQAYADLVPGGSAQELRVLLDAGHFGFAARHRGQLVGVCWAATGRAYIQYLRGHVALRAEEVFGFGLFVAPGIRGRDATGALHLYMHRDLREIGYRRALCGVLPENVAGSRVVAKLGYRRAGMIRGLGLGKHRCVLMSRGSMGR